MPTPPPRPIHFWLPALSNSTGGIQVYLQSVLEAYAAHRPEIATEVFIKNDHETPATPPGKGWRWHCFGRWREGPWRTLVFAAGLLWAAWRRRPGLIVVGHVNFVRLALWAQFFLGIPFWGVVYGIEVTEQRRASNAARLARASRIIAISRYTRDSLIDAHGLRPEQFSLLPTTIDEHRFVPGPKSEALRRKYGVPPESRIILTICRLSCAERYKGYDQILRALPAVRRAVPQAHYLLGGRGDDLPRIEQMVTEWGLNDAVTLAGYVEAEDLVACYQLCDVFAMPSESEGFGIVYIEALACGRPVLAGNRDGSVDALLDGKLGVLVDPENTDAIAASLVALLARQHPHPLVYRPEELRREVIAAYGSRQFAATLYQILDDFLPVSVHNRVM